MAGKAKAPAGGSTADTASVSAKILGEFSDVLVADTELPGIGERLKKALLEDHDFSETALRQALFGDATL
jgi:hypothetical protein